MFELPIKSRKVRNGVYAYQYRNGVVNIQGEKYFFYSLTAAIKQWRTNH
jgi:hypothetical protein